MIKLPTLTLDFFDKINAFAEACLPTNTDQYAKRGQSNHAKILKDIVTGKIGECRLAKYLDDNNVENTGSDMQIYAKKQKSWAADIVVKDIDGDLDLHVKTQSADSLKRYGASWIFQYGGNGYGHKDAIFKHPDADNAYFVGISGDSIYCAISLRTVFALDLMKEPVLPQLRNSKKAIYYRDIEGLPDTTKFELFYTLNILV